MLTFSEHHSFRIFLNHACKTAWSRLFLSCGSETNSSDASIDRINLKILTWFAVISVGIFLCNNTQAQETLASSKTEKELLTIVIGPFEKSARNHLYFFPKLLELVLSKTEATDGPFEITYHPYI